MHAIVDHEFETEVASRPGMVLVDFWANWCQPCQAAAPVIEQLAESNAWMHVVSVDVEHNPVLCSSLKVISLPTYIVFRDGVEVERISGPQSQSSLEDLFARHAS